MEFEFGTTWRFTWSVGGDIGAPLAVEGLWRSLYGKYFYMVMFLVGQSKQEISPLLSSWLVCMVLNFLHCGFWFVWLDANIPVGMEFNPDTMQ